MVPLGCKMNELKRVMSFRLQVYMFLNSKILEVSFFVFHGGNSFMVFANTDNLKLFLMRRSWA